MSAPIYSRAVEARLELRRELARIAAVNAAVDSMGLVLKGDHRRLAPCQHPLQRLLDHLRHLAARCVHGRRPDSTDGALEHGPGPAALIERIIRASEFEALAEIRDRLLGVLKAPQQLLGVHVEVVAGAAPKCRLSLQLSDAGRGLAAALGDGTGDVDRLVVEKALGHPDLSCGLQPGDDAESGAGETSLPAEPSDDLPQRVMP